MSDADAIEIRDGGVVAVDTAELREAASVLRALSNDCDALRAEVAATVGELVRHDDAAGAGAGLAVTAAHLLERAADQAGGLARALSDAADVYEIVELEAAARAAALASDHRSLPSLARRVWQARDRMPEAAAGADALLAAWPHARHAELRSQLGTAVAPLASIGGAVAAAGGLALTAIGALGRGAVGRSDRLEGRPSPMRVAPFPAPAARAPATLAALAERVPRGDDQVRVERYPRPGADRFAVYVAGTKSPLGWLGIEPLDLASNLQLYAGARSDSYDAVEAALRDAGARPGDEVLAIGHSQGGAITTRLALDSPFTVIGNVTFGSPVQGDVPAHALDVTLRHTDDPVPALQAGGHPAGVGAPGSIVVERVADPGGRIADLALGAHSMDAYTRTAALADASDDPRLRDLRDLLTDFGGGAAAVVTTYHARRPD